ncbi:MAG: hypothetical protein VYB34_04690 [Planctomycetota bacterium]|nr:hypothetical protein [Planctomycetota bacterium]
MVTRPIRRQTDCPVSVVVVIFFVVIVFSTITISAFYRALDIA